MCGRELLGIFKAHRNFRRMTIFAHLNQEIRKFTSDIQFLADKGNIFADAQSRLKVHAKADVPTVEAAQKNGIELHNMRFSRSALLSTFAVMRCIPGLFFPNIFRRQVFDALLKLVHSGIRATLTILTSRRPAMSTIQYKAALQSLCQQIFIPGRPNQTQ